METLNLSNICGGAVNEVFERELRMVLDNVKDVNTNPEQKRKITLVFEFKPLSDRSGAEVAFGCKAVLASVMAVKGSTFFMTSQGKVEAYAHDPRQAALFDPAQQPASKQ
jgi:hypothetical protein